ncbi:sensor histidine kinase [Pallidibacillus pasinlerensis]|uniref:histidine kinase n=1 Tax=Pallidibacillus pasinlerensis TaxID=2703818 RepID=A0ABX0A6M7_9BACI|nr:sensor histidine kinase [Pallidibacillus pasinlerensis]NCU18452.1 sensor histidine kinase [Pallidibacillus pasinlerensis]
MQIGYQLIPKNTGLSIFIWVVFCLLPFYFIIINSTPIEIVFGIIAILLFFAAFQLNFIKKGWTVYVSIAIEMVINVGMTLYFGYVYFSLFLAFFIGNVQNKAGFISLYVVHLVTTITSVLFGFFIQTEIFLTQLPFIIITVVGVILLPISMYNRNKRMQLEHQLADANKKIAQLVIIQERERIARDLHDTLGQKLSLIRLKSDLAEKIVAKDLDRAKKEIRDINLTAKTALNEVRDLVSMMKRTRVKEEIVRIKHMLEVAEIEYKVIGNPELQEVPIFTEHVLSMCLKEAITNIVKHSQATHCEIIIEQVKGEVKISVKDNGVGIGDNLRLSDGNGIRGMQERLEFVNGHLQIDTNNGTTLSFIVPIVH